MLIAPATPCVAPTIGTEWLEIDGRRLPARPSLGLLTQPISFIGLPVCAVPVWGCHADAADRRAADRRAVARGPRAARRRITCSRPASLARRSPPLTGIAMIDPEINLPDVVAEVTAAFARYEDALVTTASTCSTSCSGTSPRDGALRRRREPGRHRRDPRLSRGAAERRPGANARRDRHHHLRPRLRDRDDRVPRATATPRRPAEPDLGALRRRLARRRRAREPARGHERAATAGESYRTRAAPPRAPSCADRSTTRSRRRSTTSSSSPATVSPRPSWRSASA